MQEQILGIVEYRKRQMHNGKQEHHSHGGFQYQLFVFHVVNEHELGSRTIQSASSHYKAAYIDFENDFFVVELHYQRQIDHISKHYRHFLLSSDHLGHFVVLDDMVTMKENVGIKITHDKNSTMSVDSIMTLKEQIGIKFFQSFQ